MIEGKRWTREKRRRKRVKGSRKAGRVKEREGIKVRKKKKRGRETLWEITRFHFVHSFCNITF